MNNDTWRDFYKDGLGLYRAMQRGLDRPDVFTPEIIHNLAGMTIEKLFMALLVRGNRLPYNHLLFDMVEAARAIVPVDEPLAEKLRYMDSLQDLCSLEPFTKKEVRESDKSIFADAAAGVYELVRLHIGDDYGV